MTRRTRRYALADSAQQAVGGFLLAGPFVVTEEVWRLAENMTPVHAFVTVLIVAAIGYGALYGADDERDPDREQRFGGVPVRFLSLLGVSYGSVVLLAFVLTAPETFVAGNAGVTLKAISVGALFSVVGAATADSLF
jgi:uncharacterized membrane protein